MFTGIEELERLLTLRFLGGGLWHPEARPIGALRRDIDRHPERIKGVLMDDGLRKEYLGSVEKAPAKVVKAFVMSPTNSESALKTKPKVRSKSCIVMTCAALCKWFRF